MTCLSSRGRRLTAVTKPGITEELLEVRVVDAIVVDPARGLVQHCQSSLRPRDAVGIACRPQACYVFCRAGDLGLQSSTGLGEGEQVVIVLAEPLGDPAGWRGCTAIGNDRSPIRTRSLY